MNIVIKDMHEAKKIAYYGILLRLFVLLLIALLSDYFGIYFMPDEQIHDDYKYIYFAETYRDVAYSIWDYEAFVNASASVRHYVENSLDNLWFAFLAVTIYIVRYEWIIRIINILFAGISVYLLYDLAEKVYDRRVAAFASKLLAYLPYPVIFSCYIFKDQFVMFLLLLELRFIWQCKEAKTGFKDYIFALLVLIVIRYTRSGLDILLILFFGIYMIFNSIKGKKLSIYTLATFILLACIVIFEGDFLISSVTYKLNAYLSNRDFYASRIIRYMSINEITDIYRLPFSYALISILPLNLSIPLTTWYGIITKVNLCMIPVAIGNIINMVRPKRDYLFYWGSLMLIFCTIIMSSMIFRHYYCFLPISFMHFSDYWTSETAKLKAVIMIVSLILSGLCIVYFN